MRSRLIARQQSQSSPDPAGKDSATSIPILTEAGTSVRLSFQSRSLLLLADESSMRRRSGRKCIEMAKWFESARGVLSLRERVLSLRERVLSLRERVLSLRERVLSLRERVLSLR